MCMNRLVAYLWLFFLAYLPQLLNFSSYTRSYFRDSPNIELFRLSSTILYTILIIVCLLTIFLPPILTDSRILHEKYLPLQIITGVALFIFLFLTVFTTSTIVLSFSMSLIPTILSAIIGFVGTYIITCFYLRDCQSSKKYQHATIIGDLINH